MDRATEIMEAREKGQYPISIATSLAFESLAGIYPERENQTWMYDKFDALYINTRTLIRNILGSLPREVREEVTPEALAQTVLNEMDVIEATVVEDGDGKIGLTFYHFTYDGIHRRFPYALHRIVETPQQEWLKAIENNALKIIQEMVPANYYVGDMDFKKDDRRVVLITHYPVDLLNMYQFKQLVLLETHTGNLKPRAMWHTKLNGAKDVNVIPFDRMTLQIFGDGVLFRSMPPKAKKFLIDLGTKTGWTPLTTKALIISSVKGTGDQTVTAEIMRLY